MFYKTSLAKVKKRETKKIKKKRKKYIYRLNNKENGKENQGHWEKFGNYLMKEIWNGTFDQLSKPCFCKSILCMNQITTGFIMEIIIVLSYMYYHIRSTY